MQYTLVRSRRRRRSVAMQISAQGEVMVHAPQYMPKYFIDRFVREHDDWITKQLVERSRPRPQLRRHFGSIPELEQFITAKVGQYSKITGLIPARLRFTEVKSYWGSCSPDGVISFNRHLIYTPPEAVEYVIVHELCHLRYRGHGSRFWALVTKYFPAQNEMRRILRQIPRE